MRTRILTLTLGLATMPGLVACGDDNSGTTPDAPQADAPPSNTFKGYDADEGGEVRIEYVRFKGGNAGFRATAFFYKNAGSTKYFPYLNLNGCTDTSTDQNWPVAANPLAEREYLDVGEITITGGSMDATIPRTADNGMRQKDPFGREHAPGKWYFNPLAGTDTDGAAIAPPMTKFTVSFSGSADFPAQTFEDVLYMPADMVVQTPPVDPDYVLQPDQPATFTWSTPADSPPAGYEVQSLVAFTNGGTTPVADVTGPVVTCVEPNDGSVTVPADLVNKVRSGPLSNGGTLARQTLTHAVRELKDKDGPTGRRIDFIAVWCTATPFKTQ